MTDTVVPTKIAFCGEVSSGKSTALQSILRRAFLPDFFGVQNHPKIRVLLGAPQGYAVYRTVDGETHAVDDPMTIPASDAIAEIVVAFENTFGLRRPCALIEFPPLRDGHVDLANIQEIATCDALVWTTIGSQAWRLSEKTILDDFADQLPQRKLLVATRADKFRNDVDREKLWSRLEKETADYFESLHLLGVSPKAFEAPEDTATWRAAGVAEFLKSLNALLQAIPQRTGTADTTFLQESAAAASESDAADGAAAPNETIDVETAVEEETAVEPVTEIAAVEAEAETEEAAPEVSADPIAEIVGSTKGIIAVGTCDLADPSVQGHIFGDAADINRFGRFCAAAVSAAGHFANCSETSENIADMQISTDLHNLFLRFDGTKIVFIVGQSSQVSLGITRTVLSRLIAEGLANVPGLSEAA